MSVLILSLLCSDVSQVPFANVSLEHLPTWSLKRDYVSVPVLSWHTERLDPSFRSAFQHHAPSETHTMSNSLSLGPAADFPTDELIDNLKAQHQRFRNSFDNINSLSLTEAVINDMRTKMQWARDVMPGLLKMVENMAKHYEQMAHILEEIAGDSSRKGATSKVGKRKRAG